MLLVPTPSSDGRVTGHAVLPGRGPQAVEVGASQLRAALRLPFPSRVTPAGPGTLSGRYPRDASPTLTAMVGVSDATREVSLPARNGPVKSRASSRQTRSLRVCFTWNAAACR